MDIAAPARWFDWRLAFFAGPAPARAVAPARQPERAAAVRKDQDDVGPRTRWLPRGTTLAVDDPLGIEIFCIHGSLWITHDGDPMDCIVGAGHHHVALRHERMLVHALADTRLIVAPLPGA